MKIDLPDECFRTEGGGGGGGVIERGMGSIPSRPRTNFLEETWGVWGRGFIVKHEVESWVSRATKRRHSSCVETQFQRARVSIVYWIGSCQILETRKKMNEVLLSHMHVKASFHRVLYGSFVLDKRYS